MAVLSSVAISATTLFFAPSLVNPCFGSLSAVADLVMGSFSPLYAEKCNVCKTRSSFPFWQEMDGYGDEINPTAICAACRESRSQRLFHRLYFGDFPNDVSEGVWLFLFAGVLGQVAKKEFLLQVCRARASPFLSLTYCRSGDQAILRGAEVELIDHIFTYIGF